MSTPSNLSTFETESSSEPLPQLTDAGFTLLVDSREQAPWPFTEIKADKKDGGGLLVVKTEPFGLKTGDYSIKGFEDTIAIERKSKSDLFHCVGKDRERFEKQVQRLAELPFGHLIVEADWEGILRGDLHSGLDPKIVHRTVMSWTLRYSSVHWWLMPTRRHAEVTAFRLLRQFHKIQQESAV